MKKIRIFDCLFFLLVFIITFGVRFATVSGSSMENTYHDGDFLIVSKFDKSFSRGDIIVFNSDNLGKYLIKRVIGVEGDTVSFEPNGVLINGDLIYEDYIKTQQSSYIDVQDKYEVGENQYFVMGDNRNNSLDSRSSLVGMVDSSNIVGKVIFNFTKTTHLPARNVKTMLIVIFVVCSVLYMFGSGFSEKKDDNSKS